MPPHLNNRPRVLQKGHGLYTWKDCRNPQFPVGLASSTGSTPWVAGGQAHCRPVVEVSPPGPKATQPPEPPSGASAVPERAPRMLGDSQLKPGPWSCTSANCVLNTMLEPSMPYLTRSSHSIFPGRFCHLCFTGEETKAWRFRELHLGSCLEHDADSPHSSPAPWLTQRSFQG